MEKESSNIWYKSGSELPCGHKIDNSNPDAPHLLKKKDLKGLFFCPLCNKEMWLPCYMNMEIYKPPDAEIMEPSSRRSSVQSGRFLMKRSNSIKPGNCSPQISIQDLNKRQNSSTKMNVDAATRKALAKEKEKQAQLKLGEDNEVVEVPVTWVAPEIDHLIRERPSDKELEKHKKIKSTLSVFQQGATEQLQQHLEDSGAAFILCEDDEEDESKDDFQAVLDFMLSDYAQQGKDHFKERRNRAIPVLRLCRADFDANLDLEFPTKEGQIQNRGDFSYHQPSCDWLRVGLNVKGRYENDDWMGTSGGHGEWVVAYHGSKSLAGSQSIAENQEISTSGERQLHEDDKDMNPRSTRYKMKCGPGAYFACDIDIASGYAKKRMGEKCVFEVRLNPTEMRIPEGERGYAIVNDAKNARPIGICILRKVAEDKGCIMM